MHHADDLDTRDTNTAAAAAAGGFATSCPECGEAACPECGEAARPVAPVNWITPARLPRWSHASDGTALCPVVDRDGYRPADPVQHLNDASVTLIITAGGVR
ncbi:hypothetical protein [Pseudonocardia ailaonensis]